MFSQESFEFAKQLINLKIFFDVSVMGKVMSEFFI